MQHEDNAKLVTKSPKKRRKQSWGWWLCITIQHWICVWLEICDSLSSRDSENVWITVILTVVLIKLFANEAHIPLTHKRLNVRQNIHYIKKKNKGNVFFSSVKIQVYLQKLVNKNGVLFYKKIFCQPVQHLIRLL